MASASCTAEITDRDRLAFGELSGDRNPLHTESAYAEGTQFGHCVLHGAFSAGLLSRLAGMHLPGSECLLHGMRLQFVQPVFLPIKVIVEGQMVSDNGIVGEVKASIREAESGRLLVEGGYQFGYHRKKHPITRQIEDRAPVACTGRAIVLVTGASGGLGRAVCEIFGDKALGISRAGQDGSVAVPDLGEIDQRRFESPLAGIVHCAWPRPDNDGLLILPDPSNQVEYHIGRPLQQVLALARLLRDQGEPGATLVLVGSSFAQPGRHAWRMPLYSLSKSLLPNLLKMLAIELAESNHRVTGISLDVVRGGMNSGLGPVSEQAHADRSIWGELPDMGEIAAQVAWIIANPGRLLSGAMVDLTSAAMP